MITFAGDWVELTERWGRIPHRPVLIRLSAIRAIRPENDREGSVIALGPDAAPIHVTQEYAEFRDSSLLAPLTV